MAGEDTSQTLQDHSLAAHSQLSSTLTHGPLGFLSKWRSLLFFWSLRFSLCEPPCISIERIHQVGIWLPALLFTSCLLSVKGFHSLGLSFVIHKNSFTFLTLCENPQHVLGIQWKFSPLFLLLYILIPELFGKMAYYFVTIIKALAISLNISC